MWKEEEEVEGDKKNTSSGGYVIIAYIYRINFVRIDSTNVWHLGVQKQRYINTNITLGYIFSK